MNFSSQFRLTATSRSCCESYPKVVQTLPNFSKSFTLVINIKNFLLQDKKVLEQIEQVKIYLISFSEQQVIKMFFHEFFILIYPYSIERSIGQSTSIFIGARGREEQNS